MYEVKIIVLCILCVSTLLASVTLHIKDKDGTSWGVAAFLLIYLTTHYLALSGELSCQ